MLILEKDNVEGVSTIGEGVTKLDRKNLILKGRMTIMAKQQFQIR